MEQTIDPLVTAREELWDNPNRACALALIEIARLLRAPEMSDDGSITELDAL